MKYTQIGGRTESTPLWGVFFVTQRISEFAPVGNIGVPALESRSLYDPSFSEASRYPGKRTNVYHHRVSDGEIQPSMSSKLSKGMIGCVMKHQLSYFSIKTCCGYSKDPKPIFKLMDKNIHVLAILRSYFVHLPFETVSVDSHDMP